jgi:hypothetical protein
MENQKLEPQRTPRSTEENLFCRTAGSLLHHWNRNSLIAKNPTLAKTALGWGTLKFRYAARSLES